MMSLSLVFQSKGRLLTTAQRAIITTTNTQRRTMSSFSHMSDNDPDVLSKEKEKQKKTENREWNEKLASDSEAAVSIFFFNAQYIIMMLYKKRNIFSYHFKKWIYTK